MINVQRYYIQDWTRIYKNFFLLFISNDCSDVVETSDDIMKIFSVNMQKYWMQSCPLINISLTPIRRSYQKRIFIANRKSNYVPYKELGIQIFWENRRSLISVQQFIDKKKNSEKRTSKIKVYKDSVIFFYQSSSKRRQKTKNYFCYHSKIQNSHEISALVNIWGFEFVTKRFNRFNYW